MTLQKGLVGHWTMDDADTSGGTLYDRSAYDNHGTLKNGVTTGASSIIGEAYSFDTSTDYLDLPRGNSILPTKATTCSLWAKRAGSTGDRQTVLLTGRDVNSGVEFRDNLMRIHTQNNEARHNFGLTNGDWTHLALSYESGSGGAFYIDGSQVSSISDGGDIVYPEFYGNAPTIGSHGGGLYEFNGDVTDTRIYNRALSGSEISALYNMRSQRQQRNTLAKRLVARYCAGADSITSDTLLDVTPYNTNAGTQSLTTQTGKFDTALDVDGNTVTFNSQPFRDAVANANYSITMWVKQDDQSSGSRFRDVIVWNDGTTKQSTKRIERASASSSTNQDYWINLGMNPNDNKGALFSNDIGVSNNTWWHLAVVVDATNNEFTVYVNGSADTQSAVDEAEIADPGNVAVNQGPYGGAIEDLRFYARPLSSDEVSRLANNVNPL
jgi:hypothetical protein